MGDQGAALLTKYPTYKQDVQLGWTFEAYTKEHYNSWVTFARERGHPNDIKPVLVTGVDLTRDFAMMSYSSDGDDLTAEFTISAPGDAAPWGRWRTPGMVYTNCGPQLCRPPSTMRAVDSVPSGDNHHMETVSDDYHQCVFIRYYTMRKRLGIPRVMKAAAGPHDLGPRGQEGEGSSLEAQYESDSNSDTMSSPLGDGAGDDPMGSDTSVDSSESDVVIHNTSPVRSALFLSILSCSDQLYRTKGTISTLLRITFSG